MSTGNSKNGLLVIIAVVAIAILGVLLYQANQDSPAEEVAESIGDAASDIGDAAQDATN